MRVLDQLITVAIACYNDDVMTLIICVRCKRRDDVVTFIT